MGDSIHKTHFQVPEMPWREKEKQAILLFKRMLEIIPVLYDPDLDYLIMENKDLVEWIKKYELG